MAENQVSNIIVDFPDCARLGTHEDLRPPEGVHDTITITTENCPASMPGPPPLFGTGEIIAAVLVGLALIAGVAVVRFKAHEQKPAKLAARNEARKIELDAEVARIKAARRQKCGICGDVYDPDPE